MNIETNIPVRPVTFMSDEKRKDKAEVAYFMRRLYARGLTTTSGGNISLRTGKDRILITPSGSDKGRMRVGEIGVVDLDGQPVSKGFKPSIETLSHTLIYRARDDIASVIHAHPPQASALSASSIPVNTSLFGESRAILGEIAYVGYHRMGSAGLAEALAAALTTSNCAIMRNHGVVAVGSSLLEAFDRIEVLEAAAALTVASLTCLKPFAVEIPEADLLKIDEMMSKAERGRCHIRGSGHETRSSG